LAKDKNIIKECIAPRYITRFQCRGSSCEDTCCGWWKVSVDEAHYRKLEKLMDRSEESRHAFSQAFIKQDNGSAGTFGLIRMGDDGYCRYLSEGHLCMIHKDYGPEFLPDICAIFPRMISLVGKRLELTGQLSCPQTARLCLLADDALDLVDFDPAGLFRPKFLQRQQSTSDDPYAWYFDDIRSTLLRLLSFVEFPLSSRFYFILYLAEQISPFFTRGTKTVDEEKLVIEINGILHPEVLNELHTQFISLKKTPDPIVMEAVQRVLLSRLQHDNCRPGYTRLVTDTFVGYEYEYFGKTFEPGQSNISLTLSPAKVLQSYKNRRAFWEENHNRSIERYFNNYSMNYILNTWYTGWPDLNAYVRSLLIRVAAIKFLMFSHPRIFAGMNQHAARTGEVNNLRAELDSVAVDACYNFTRNIGHSPELNNQIENILDRLGMNTFESRVQLVDF